MSQKSLLLLLVVKGRAGRLSYQVSADDQGSWAQAPLIIILVHASVYLNVYCTQFFHRVCSFIHPLFERSVKRFPCA